MSGFPQRRPRAATVVRVEGVDANSTLATLANRCFVAGTVLRDDPTTVPVVEIPTKTGRVYVGGERGWLIERLCEAQRVGLVLERCSGTSPTLRRAVLLGLLAGAPDAEKNPVILAVFPQFAGLIADARDSAAAVLRQNNRVIREMARGGVL